MKKIALALGLLVPSLALPIEGVYVGGVFGHVAFTDNPTRVNALGFGGEVALRTNPVLDVALRSQWSSHGGGGGMSLWANTLSADLLVGHFNDIEIFLGGGPGFYQFAGLTTAGRFGLHADVYADLVVSDAVKLGLAWRFHGIFSPAAGEGSFWTVMARVGFYFGMDQ